MFEKLLLAIDGSEHALQAARVAGELARTTKSKELRIVAAYDQVPSYLGEPNLQAAIDARLNEAQARLDAALQAVGKIPGQIHTELIEGPAADAIIDVAATRESNLIVMGSRGLGQLAGLLVGSVSQKVINHAPCPVLITK